MIANIIGARIEVFPENSIAGPDVSLQDTEFN
jgi:hypothetical protein